MFQIDRKVVVSVIVGGMATGLLFWFVNKLPSGNIVTDTVKKAKSVAATK